MAKSLKEKMDCLSSAGNGSVVDALALLKIEGTLLGIYPVKDGTKFIGRAYTAKCTKEDVEKPYGSYKVISLCKPGDVLLVAGANGQTMIGDNVARFGVNQELSAIVWEGTCRDKEAISQLSVPVYCQGVNNRAATKYKICAVDVPVTVGDVEVKPGDILMGDGDGVVCVPFDRLDDVIYQVEKVVEVETQMSAALDRKAGVEEVSNIIKQKKIPRE